jgi:hypothetical protein
MKKTSLLLIMALALCTVALAQNIPTVSVNANNVPNAVDRVFDPSFNVFGRSYSEWSAAWEQWAYSIPASNHPLFDTTTDCSVGQSGPVWFLGGKFCSNGATCSFTGIVRSCSIPSGKALYFPIIDSEDSALEEDINEHPGDTGAGQINAMRAYAASNMDPAIVAAWLDGVPIPKLQQRYRVQSPAFSFTIPEDNYLAAVYPAPNAFKAGSYYPAVDDGWFLMLAPLPPGRHVLQFQGTIGTFVIGVRYNLNVLK